MFLSLGSTSRSSNSAAALFGGHGQGQGSSDWEQFDRGRAFERLPRQQQQNETEIDPLQALAGGKYSSLQRRQHHHFQNSPRPFHQVQTSSPFDIQVPNIDGTPPMIPFPLSSAILPSTFGQLQLPSTSFSTSTTTNSGGGCSYLQPSPSLPSSSLQPSLSRDSHGSVFGNGGEEVLSARINEQGTGAAVGGKRTSVALLLAKQVKEKLGINKLREVVQHDAVSGAGINKNNKNISNNNNNSVLLQQRSSSPGCSPGLSISPWEWEHADHDRNFGLTKDDISAMAPSPSPNRRPNNVHASRLCSTSSLASVGDRGFDVKETVLGAKNLESLADEGGRSLSGSMESSLGSELERSRPGFVAHRSCPLPATSTLADSLGFNKSTRGAQQFGGGTWGGGASVSTGTEVCSPSSLLSAQFTTPTSPGDMVMPETDAPAAMAQFLKEQTAVSRGWRTSSAARAPVLRRQFPEAAAMGVCRQDPAVVRQIAPQTTRFGGSFGDIDSLLGGGDADSVNYSSILSELFESVDAINNDFFSDLQGEVAAMDNDMPEAVLQYGDGARQQKPWEKYVHDQSARMWHGGVGGMADDASATTALSEIPNLQVVQGLKRTRSVRDGDDSCDIEVAQTKRSCARATNNTHAFVNSASLAGNLEQLLGSLPPVVGTPSFQGASGNTFGEVSSAL